MARRRGSAHILCLDGFSFGKLGHFDDGCGSLFQWIAFLAEALVYDEERRSEAGRGARQAAAAAARNVLSTKRSSTGGTEEEAVASGDVDDFVAVAAARGGSDCTRSKAPPSHT